MPKLTTEQKIGGEYGDVRAVIDVEKLNAYLEAHVPEVTAPVTVKQFKVRVQGHLFCDCWLTVASDLVRAGTLVVHPLAAL